MTDAIDIGQILPATEDADADVYSVRSRATGPSGELPLDEELVISSPSGDIFAFSQNAGMGWNPAHLGRTEFLVISTLGGIRAPDGTPIALGYHTGHWEVGLLMEAAAREVTRLGGIPYAAYCSDPCDGRSQGTTGMFDSLPYRNDAAIVMRRLIRSLPRRRGVIGVGTCDKGLPALLIALAGCPDLPVIILPGGVTLPPEQGEDAGKIQSVGSRLAHGEITIGEINDMGCRACASPGGGCQFLGTAATAQVVAEALGLTLTHAALAPSGEPVWRDMAVRSGRAIVALEQAGIRSRDIITDDAIHNAMVVHAAFGGSTNLLLHVPAIAHAAGLRRPVVDDWDRINRQVPRIVDVLPNGPQYHVTVRAFLAGGVPEVMLHLRAMGLLKLDAMTATGQSLGENLAWWEGSERRRRFREILKAQDSVDADDVIMGPEAARAKGMTSTVCFPTGNLAPEGSVVKATAIAADMLDEDGVYSLRGPARVFTSEKAAMAAIKGNEIRAGDVLVLLSIGPMGTGMEEIAQVTIALKYCDFGKDVALLTDARFSGFSSGPCIGHLGPEALAGGPVGRILDGDVIEVVVDTRNLKGQINLVGEGDRSFDADEGARVLAAREARPDLAPDADLPEDTRLWAALQRAGGGTWGGCVYDVDEIIRLLDAGRQALDEGAST
ncbi:MAG TPA: YjhG/YagF family D-xylonate dehydratase [Candidatus Latescibacteria bacterium]|nr:YjhG/YagF family D-xylonate dehydratase [Candidatus Latescibacterota bacterium]|tara:strand:- start:764 stop:2764 length:2001 start_codon:yes stop_codon:yes gene_type:complete